MKPSNYIGKSVAVTMDRPMGSRHPQRNYLYPLNYGFLSGTLAPDGHELDAYVLGVFEPVDQFEGTCIAVLHRLNDDDDKLIVVPHGKQYSDAQIQALTEFQEQFFVSIIIR